MKTILHIIDTTGPGGAETVFIDLATCLSTEKYRSVVVIRGKGWVYEELRRRGITPIIIPAKGSFNWRYLLTLARLIRAEKVDLIQSHLLGSNVYSALAGLITRRPVVATFHGAVDIGVYERLKWLKFGAMKIGVQYLVAVSASLRAELAEQMKVRTDKLEVIYNGIQTRDFQRPRSDELREQFGWGKDCVIVGSLGNIRDAKGYDILLEAAALLADTGTPYRFVIAGQGKAGLYDNLLTQRQKLNLDNMVKFLGFNNDPAGFLSNLDLFLLSSTSEGFSIATIQAMASEVPVIVTRSGGPEEIVTHEQNGWMIDPGSPVAIAEGLETLSHAPDLCREMAVQGKQHACSTFDIEAMLESYDRLYRNLIR